jgi:hypothetical protein
MTDTELTHRTLWFDCATNRWHTDKATGAQPALIRLAWMLEGEQPQCRIIALPEGATVDPSTFPYHKVDPALRPGVSLLDVLGELLADADRADRFASFNGEFHQRQIHRAFASLNMGWVPLGEFECLMKAATPILNMPLMRPGGGLKSPKLSEACTFFMVATPSSNDPIEYGQQVVRAVSEIGAAVYPKVMS